MNTWVKWLIPLGLAIVAAVLNYLAGAQKQELDDYLRVKQDLKKGDKFSPDSLEKISVPAKQAGLKEAAIPYKDRAVLFGKVCPRDLTQGDIVFWRDTVPPPMALSLQEGELAITIKLDNKVYFPPFVKVGDEIGFMVTAAPAPESAKPDPSKPPISSNQEFEYVGPFRLVGIDRLFAREDPDRLTDRSYVSEDRDVTVAFKLINGTKADANTTRLLQARLQRQAGGQSGVEALVLHGQRLPKKAPFPATKQVAP